jgi:Putative adhesin
VEVIVVAVLKDNFAARFNSSRLGGVAMLRKHAATLVTVTLMLAGALVAESRKELHFTVGPRAGVSVMNPYGSISVKPSQNNTVVVYAVLHSDRVEVDNNQSGNRVDIQSHLLPGADAESGRVDYEILVPADASITLHSSTGSLHAEKLHGDVNLEGPGAAVDVRDISNAHVHVKTMNGAVNLDNIQNGHVEVDSLSGEVTLNSVNGSLVQVVSTSGRINYTGDFGNSGEYRLTSHSGDIDATIPEWTSADVSARSVRGEVHDDIPLQPKTHTYFPLDKGRAFAGTVGRVAVSSTVVLRTFSGKIHLRKRSEKP